MAAEVGTDAIEPEYRFLENENREGSLLEAEFNEPKCDQTLVPLIPVIEGLMKYLPSSRITASQALHLLGAKNSGVEKGWLESVREGGLGVGLCFEKWEFFEKMESKDINQPDLPPHSKSVRPNTPVDPTHCPMVQKFLTITGETWSSRSRMVSRRRRCKLLKESNDKEIEAKRGARS
ncbi:hypothetical protein V8E54_008745 [Elaphomyces granulatus]